MSERASDDISRLGMQALRHRLRALVRWLFSQTCLRRHSTVPYYVYLLTSKRDGPLYCGVTNDLVRRVYEHREGFVAGFTKRYCATKLVWFESHEDVLAAITREKRIKRWLRAWKIELITAQNPTWHDLYDEIC